MREAAAAVRERAILFQGPMVRGLLREVDPKTQTRRAVKWRGLAPGLNLQFTGLSVERSGSNWVLTSPTRTSHEYRSVPQPCPYGQPGDRLWVREAFRTYSAYDGESMGDMQARLSCSDAEMARIAPIQYEADGHRANWLSPCADPGRYRHARFMPRWASRITLEITEVRVQRLQEISEADAKAEGLSFVADGCARWGVEGIAASWCDCPITAYAALWDWVNGAGSWDANPWVWAVSFRRMVKDGQHG